MKYLNQPNVIESKKKRLRNLPVLMKYENQYKDENNKERNILNSLLEDTKNALQWGLVGCR